MNTAKIRAIGSTLLACGIAASYLMATRAAGITGTGMVLLAVGGAAAVTCLIGGAVLMRVMGRTDASPTASRMIMETTGMLAITAPAAVAIGAGTGWIG